MAIHHVNLIRIDFPQALCLAEYGHDIEFNGETYRADSSLLLEVGDVTEENTLNTSTFDLTLGATPEMVALMRTGAWLNLPITHLRQWYEDGSLVETEVIFKGRLIEQDENDGLSEKTVRFSCSSHFLDWESFGGRTTSNASQQIYDANDRGFEHAGKEKKNIKWGKA